MSCCQSTASETSTTFVGVVAEAVVLDSPVPNVPEWTTIIRSATVTSNVTDVFSAAVSASVRRTDAGVTSLRLRLLAGPGGRVVAERIVSADSATPPTPPQLLTLDATVTGAPRHQTRAAFTVELQGTPAALVHNLTNILEGSSPGTLVAYLTSAANFSSVQRIVFVSVDDDIDGVYVPQSGTGPGVITFLSNAIPPPSPGFNRTLPGAVLAVNILSAAPVNATTLQLTLNVFVSTLGIRDGDFIVVLGLYENGVLSALCNTVTVAEVVSTGAVLRVPYVTPSPTPTFTGGVVSPLASTVPSEDVVLTVTRAAGILTTLPVN